MVVNRAELHCDSFYSKATRTKSHRVGFFLNTEPKRYKESLRYSKSRKLRRKNRNQAS